jgi:hypothetical protein
VGVSFFPCDYCSRSICDCGDYIRCNDNCERRWCNDNCAEQDGFRRPDWDGADKYQDRSCSYCRNEEAEDFALLKFMLKKYNVTRDEILKEYLASNKDE